MPEPIANPVTSADWLARGQQHEAEATPASLASALACYDRALEILRLFPASTETQHVRDFGVAWMNRGNALQKLATPDSLAESVTAYDEAIALLQKLPLLENRAVRINLAAAWMNLANALVLLIAAPGDSSAEASAKAEALAKEALAAAKNSLAVTGTLDSSDSAFAELALKARRVQCDALGHLLVAVGPDRDAIHALANEAADAADQGLALVRHWEFHGVKIFRPLAARLYRFGARLCLLHQPHFLAEFLLESLDPTRAPGALADDPELHAFAAEFIPDALATLRATSLVGFAPAQAQRLHEAVTDLESARARLAELRPG